MKPAPIRRCRIYSRWYLVRHSRATRKDRVTHLIPRRHLPGRLIEQLCRCGLEIWAPLRFVPADGLFPSPAGQERLCDCGKRSIVEPIGKSMAVEHFPIVAALRT